VKSFEAGLRDDAARVRAADEAVRAATTENERWMAERDAIARRAEYVRSLGIGFLGRGRVIPGLPLVVVLEGWLKLYGAGIGPEALDALIGKLGGNIERRET
jgi:hypothetical protein